MAPGPVFHGALPRTVSCTPVLPRSIGYIQESGADCQLRVSFFQHLKNPAPYRQCSRLGYSEPILSQREPKKHPTLPKDDPTSSQSSVAFQLPAFSSVGSAAAGASSHVASSGPDFAWGSPCSDTRALAIWLQHTCSMDVRTRPIVV